MSAVGALPNNKAQTAGTSSPGTPRNRGGRSRVIPPEAPDLPSSDATTTLVLDDPILQAIANKAPTVLLQQQQPNTNSNQPQAAPVTLTLYIPTSAVGAVIGRRGQNIAHLQKIASQAATTTCPVRVSVVGATSSSDAPQHSYPHEPYTELDWSDPAWTPMVIRADPTAALAAAAALQTIDQVILDVPLSRNKHAAVVGKRGQTLATLSADHNVRIMVPNKELRHDMIQLEGDLTRVKECLAAVLAVCAKKEEPAQVTVAQCPSQTKLRTVARKTDCVVKKKRMNDGFWQLQVTGPPEQVQVAVAMLTKWNEEIMNSESGGVTTVPPEPNAGAPLPRRKARGSGGGNNNRKGALKKKGKPGEGSS